MIALDQARARLRRQDRTHAAAMRESGMVVKLGTVQCSRFATGDYGSGEQLTREIVEDIVRSVRLIKRGRYPERDALLNLMTWRHGLIVPEAAALRWQGVRYRDRLIDIGEHVHPLEDCELSLLRRWRREQPKSSSGLIFATERGGPLTTDGFRRMLERYNTELARVQERAFRRIKALSGEVLPARMWGELTPRLLRHACGYELAWSGWSPQEVARWMRYTDPRHVRRYFRNVPANIPRPDAAARQDLLRQLPRPTS